MHQILQEQEFQSLVPVQFSVAFFCLNYSLSPYPRQEISRIVQDSSKGFPTRIVPEMCEWVSREELPRQPFHHHHHIHRFYCSAGTSYSGRFTSFSHKIYVSEEDFKLWWKLTIWPRCAIMYMQALMIDDRDRLEYNINQFHETGAQFPGINQAWEALLFLALLWMSEKCARFEIF